MSQPVGLKVASIVEDAGGRVVGRTRLQKIAYLLTAVGLEDGLSFEYKHYGPYSEGLATAARDAQLMGWISEVEQQASWGGMYSTYSLLRPSGSQSLAARRSLAQEAAAADAVELELAATAVFLSREGHSEPWEEVARRKPEKAADGRLANAKTLYARLTRIPVPKAWPKLV